MSERIPSEMIADVVIVGYGGAGACAAIAARDAGAEVIILEKMAQPGGNTRLSNCSWFCPSPGTEAQAIEHIDTLCFGRTARPVIEAYVAAASRNKEWIESLGAATRVTRFLTIRYPQVTHPSWPNFPGSGAMVNHTAIPERDNQPPGERLFGLLAGQVDKRGIKVLTSAPARELLTDAGGAVIGVVVERDGARTVVKARRGVILTCGGFEFNEAMKDEYLGVMPFHGIGSPGNTGDGIEMARKVGASMWHMGVAAGAFGLKTAEYVAPFGISYASPGFIYVNKHGKRFCNETGWELHFAWQALCCFDPRSPGYPTLPIFGLCDRDTLRKGALHAGASGTSVSYKWSADNSAEVAKGWIREGKTLADLAKRIGAEPAVLEKTVERYNEQCKAGNEPDFHRARETLKPLTTPPYYAVELMPWLVNTMGGPRRDEKARVISSRGEPISRLYSAGELGSLWGHLYCGGGNVGEALAVGRIAGVNAAAEKNWC